MEKYDFQQIQYVYLHCMILVINILFESSEYGIDDYMSYLIRNNCVTLYRFENKFHELTS
jgi:hypothetical protein